MSLPSGCPEHHRRNLKRIKPFSPHLTIEEIRAASREYASRVWFPARKNKPTRIKP